MKKLFVIGAVAIGTIASAFPFRTSCGMVFQISNDYAASVTRATLTHTLKQLNYSACGTVPSTITFYTS
jgi:hypothetical protein